MDTKINLLDIKVESNDELSDTIQVTPKIVVKMKYPEFSVLKRAANFENASDMAFDMIIESIESVYDGEQFHYAKESSPEDLIEFVESLNQEQFSKLEDFFNNLPKMSKAIGVTCSKCGFNHTIEVEGLDNFFG